MGKALSRVRLDVCGDNGDNDQKRVENTLRGGGSIKLRAAGSGVDRYKMPWKKKREPEAGRPA
jgi:hypothetical protein